MNRSRGRPEGTTVPAYAEVLRLASHRLSLVDGPKRPTQAVREAINILGIDLADFHPSSVRHLLPVGQSVAALSLPHRSIDWDAMPPQDDADVGEAPRLPYAIPSDAPVVEYLARRIKRGFI